MVDAANHSVETFGQRLKRTRRRVVKQSGKKFIRSLASFLGRQSIVEDKPVVDSKHFPFLKEFEDNWQTIHAEVKEILKHREDIPLFHDVSPDQMRISTGANWRTFILFGFGQKLQKNVKQAPFTTALLERVPNIQTAWFSILGPNYHIPAHRGVTKGILRCHLGLIIPKDSRNCYLRIENQIQVWEQGKLFVFDDTYDHEVFNNTDEERVILLFDFDRPMRFWGRTLNKAFVSLMKLTAYYQEPKRNMSTFEDRFEAATRRNNENYEKLSDDI